jgi:hypothetical protein
MLKFVAMTSAGMRSSIPLVRRSSARMSVIMRKKASYSGLTAHAVSALDSLDIVQVLQRSVGPLTLGDQGGAPTAGIINHGGNVNAILFTPQSLECVPGGINGNGSSAIPSAATSAAVRPVRTESDDGLVSASCLGTGVEILAGERVRSMIQEGLHTILLAMTWLGHTVLSSSSVEGGVEGSDTLSAITDLAGWGLLTRVHEQLASSVSGVLRTGAVVSLVFFVISVALIPMSALFVFRAGIAAIEQEEMRTKAMTAML